MANGEVIVSSGEGQYAVKVIGRATFDCVAPLRDLAKKLDTVPFTEVNIDLGQCQSMDSTFMGVLAMMALRAKKISALITIYNADDANKALLYGLGLKKLFQFTEGEMAWFEGDAGDTTAACPANRIQDATTVLEAHKTLMDVDEGNIKKFEKVVDFVQKDLDRLNGK